MRLVRRLRGYVCKGGRGFDELTNADVCPVCDGEFRYP